MWVETFQDFNSKHAPGGYIDTEDNWRLYADGAVAQTDPYNTGRLMTWKEPPSDPIQLLHVRRHYLNAKLKRERADWERFYHDVAQQAINAAKFPGASPPPPADAKQQLDAGNQRIEKLLAAISEIDATLAQTPDAVEQRKRQESLNELAAIRRQQRDDILSVHRK